MGLDVGIHFQIYIWRTTPAGYVSALKNTEKTKQIRQSKRVQRNDQEDNFKLREGSVYSAGAEFDNFLVNLTSLVLSLLLTFIHKMT